jgi:hypothetical protein
VRVLVAFCAYLIPANSETILNFNQHRRDSNPHGDDPHDF